VIKAHVQAGLTHMKSQGGGSSTYPTRVLLQAQAPSVEMGELTDKGYVNQRAVLNNRVACVLELYSDASGMHVIFME